MFTHGGRFPEYKCFFFGTFQGALLFIGYSYRSSGLNFFPAALFLIFLNLNFFSVELESNSIKNHIIPSIYVAVFLCVIVNNLFRKITVLPGVRNN